MGDSPDLLVKPATIFGAARRSFVGADRAQNIAQLMPSFNVMRKGS